MEDRNQEDLRELFGRFMEPTNAEAAARDIRDADEVFQSYPAPKPRGEMVVGIKLQIRTKLAARPQKAHPFRQALVAAAAVVIVALLAFYGRSPQISPEVSYAALIPSAVWESEDIASDDMDLAYFASEIRRIETQVVALEAGHTVDVRVATLHEVETELMHIDTEFWKE